jgi:ubiquinone/menaquinone biosynthesis C-methylase UbiE
MGRRKVDIGDASAWVFNRMADVYDARPAYPGALVDALVRLAGPGGRVLDVGAGIGHLALPLAERGLIVTVVEPAEAMLSRLRERAGQRGLTIAALHAAAEALPLARGAFELAIVADAVHFLDAELTGLELGRVLAPGGALALITCELADTPFMRSVVSLMEASAPRRPRHVQRLIAQLAGCAGVTLQEPQCFRDDAPVDAATLERIVRSISFIGPAMNAERFAAFRARLHALPEPPVWARTFTLLQGKRRG